MQFCAVSGQNKNVAWIESKFVDNIVYDRKADGKYLFPVEGFQMENGKLFILAYNGEITPLKYKKTATDYEIENFGSYISEFSWSENLESLYRKAVFTFRYDNEDICLTIKTAKERKNAATSATLAEAALPQYSKQRAGCSTCSYQTSSKTNNKLKANNKSSVTNKRF